MNLISHLKACPLMEKTIQENRENTTLERQGNCQFYDATMYDVSFNNASK